jgi:predicted HTH transcriptional regulator
MHLKNFETVQVDDDQLLELRRLALEGEGLQLEFKRRATHPEKVVREMIAFANTNGGTLLVGIDDDGSIPGIKYPDEESMGIEDMLQLCKPKLVYHALIVAIADDRYVIRYDIPQSDKRPHFFEFETNLPSAYVRVADMSIKASAEMQEIIRRSKKKKDIQFTYGEHEKMLMEYLQRHSTITLAEFRTLTKLNRFKASRKLILLVLADVLKVTASEKGDVYSRA